MPINSNNNNNSKSSSSSSSISTSSSNKKAKTNMSDNKQEEKMREEFRVVRNYILACPLLHVSSSVSSDQQHPAIKAALNGLDQERKRLERDAKLQKKFSSTAATTESPSDVTEAAVMVANPSFSMTTSTTNTSTTEKATTSKHDDGTDDQTDNDWQDLAAVQADDDVLMETGGDGDDENHNNNKHHAAAASDDSVLGDRLSAEVIRIIAQQHSVTVTTPLAAIAVALHAAMRSTILGFACTGMPEDEKTSSNGGFAPPVRELPATQLLPINWDHKKNGGDDSDIISLRYRKKGTGSVVLHVSATNNSSSNNNNNPVPTMVHVTLVPSAAPEPPSESLAFALSDHVNLDSFARAAASSSSRCVPPALHYKALSSLLTKFCTTFDLGSVHDGDGDDNSSNADNNKNMPYVDTSIQHYPVILPPHLATGNGSSYMMKQPQQPPKFTQDEPPPPQFPSMICTPRDPRLDPPTIESAFPGLRDPSRNGGGDFDMDKGLPGMGAGVLPGGGSSGLGGFLGDPMQGGNLMGPNHPIFTGAGVGGAHPPHYLVPRYDPVFGPPGGPGDVQEQDPNNPLNNNRFRPRGDGGGGPIKPNFNGNPNPDHFPPPGGSGHDMFS